MYTYSTSEFSLRNYGNNGLISEHIMVSFRIYYWIKFVKNTSKYYTKSPVLIVTYNQMIQMRAREKRSQFIYEQNFDNTATELKQNLLFISIV